MIREEEKKEIDISEEIPVLQGEGLDEAVLQAKDLMNTFVKSVKAFRLYPPENPSLNEFQEQTLNKFNLFLNKYQAFAFQIGEFDFGFQGKLLYENKDLKSSLAFQFYKDGLRELRFIKGLERWEVQKLMDIIKRMDHISRLEDDLVTMLWEADFIHISYLATDEFLDETPVVIPENVQEFRKHLVFEPLAHKVDQDFGAEEEQDEFDLEAILSRRPAGPPPVAEHQGLYFLTSDELERLRREVESEIAPTSVFNIIDILFEILALENNLEPYQEAVEVLGKLLEALITLGEFQKATDLITRLNIILNTYQLQDWQIKLIRQLIETSGEPKRIERIGKILEQDKGKPLEEVSGFLLLLGPNSIPPLIRVLGELNNAKARRMICDVLCEIGRNSIEVIIPFMNDRRWFLVRNIIYILTRIGKEQALPDIQKAIHHPDERVRREVISALGVIGGTKVFGLLAKALTDGNDRVRCMAALNLAKVGKTASLPLLFEVVQSKEFSKRDKTEVKAFFDAIGITASDEAIPLLQKLLEQKSWFWEGKKMEIRAGAANALALIGTPEAKAILNSGKDSKDQNIRQACLQAMERVSL